nr:hypothetical protein [uncultured Campylobacter sp.]
MVKFYRGIGGLSRGFTQNISCSNLTGIHFMHALLCLYSNLTA